MRSSAEFKTVYRVERDLSSAGSAYYLKSTHAPLEAFSCHGGYLVRYGGRLWKLHPENEFARFVRDAKQTGTVLYVNGARYRSSWHLPLAFFLAWDRIGQDE